MNKNLIIGDHHGKNKEFGELLSTINPLDYDKVICIGDFGIGFSGKLGLDKVRFLVSIILGNHDSRSFAIENKDKLWDLKYDYIDRGTIIDETLYLGGAFSIDKSSRTQGVSWFEDEEMSHSEFYTLMDKLEKVGSTIKTVISHELPESIVPKGLEGVWINKPIKTRTSDFYENMLAYLPNLKHWVAGHYHKNLEYFDEKSGVTYYIVDELSTLELSFDG